MSKRNCKNKKVKKQIWPYTLSASAGLFLLICWGIILSAIGDPDRVSATSGSVGQDVVSVEGESATTNLLQKDQEDVVAEPQVEVVEEAAPEEVTVEEVAEIEAVEAETEEVVEETVPEVYAPTFDVTTIPAYTDAAYVDVNNGVSFFAESDMTTLAFEEYSPLDDLGRCGVVWANVCQELMPTEARGNIGDVKPTGWHTVKYNDLIDGNYLYNRCHLIGYQLSGENANTRNLITGTRYLNVEGMLPFENQIADYVELSGYHVLYRVTPIFEGDNLVASGVLMEAKSVEDGGEGLEFCVYCYNVQPSIEIDYASGESKALVETPEKAETQTTTTETAKADNTKTKKTTSDTQKTTTQSKSKKSTQTTAPATNNTTTTETVQQPAPEPAPAQAQAQPASSGTCWKSATGSKYHSRSDCGNMNPNKATQITIEQAEAQGLGRCSKCW